MNLPSPSFVQYHTDVLYYEDENISHMNLGNSMNVIVLKEFSLIRLTLISNDDKKGRRKSIKSFKDISLCTSYYISQKLASKQFFKATVIFNYLASHIDQYVTFLLLWKHMFNRNVKIMNVGIQNSVRQQLLIRRKT